MMNEAKDVKQTEIGLLPTDWSACSLSEILKYCPRSETVQDDTHYNLMGVRWYANGPYLHNSKLGKALQTKTVYRVRKGDVVYNRMWPTKGAFAVIDVDLGDTVATNEYPIFEPNPTVDIQYLKYVMKTEDFWRRASSYAKGTTGRSRLHQNDFLKLKIAVPSLFQQKKIADILTSVDYAISKTEAIIEQTEKVKKGLVQQLFTKGIGHTKFKQTEIGEIPEQWEVKQLEQVCVRIFVGIATSTTNSYTDVGVPLIRNQNILEDKLDSSELIFITQEFSELNRNKRLVEGDVITVRTGYPGKSCVVTKEFEGSQTFTTLISRPNKSVLYPYFLSRYINSDSGKRFVNGGKAGGAQQNLNVAIMNKMPVPIPSLNEQHQLVEIIDSFDNKLMNEKAKLNNLLNLKKGLMQVLLTGKVRVEVDDQEAVTT